jgi:tetratricopeptide (TPR) repeat protein
MKLIRTVFIASILSFFSCSSEMTYEQKVNKYHELSNKSSTLIEEGKFKLSIDYSKAAIDITDTLPTAIYLKGLALLELNKLEEAKEDFSKVIEIEGDSSRAYKERAKVYFKTSDSDFIDDIDTFLEYHPENEEAHILKRDYFERNEDFGGAINEYNFAINKYKDSIELLEKRAALYYKNSDYKESIQDYEKIIKLEPENENAKIKKAQILALLNTNGDKNIFFMILILIYLIYACLSYFIFKPIVAKKAITQIGGEFEISKDPLIWILPILLTCLFLYLLYNDLIPKF